MKQINCVLCSQGNFSLQDLINHYIIKHNLEKTNQLLIKYLSDITTPNQTKVESCVVCEEITDNKRQKSKHMLHMHYKLDSEAIENLPIKKTVNYIEELKKNVYTASIYRTEHFYDYQWNKADIVDSFLHTAKLLIDSLRIKEVKPSKRITVNVSYTIVNKDTRSIITRYLPVRSWITPAFRTSSLNEVTMENLSSQIRSKIIQNGESGSHITFSHFKSFQMNVSGVNNEEILSVFGGNDELPKEVGCCLNVLIISGILITAFLIGIIISILTIL